MNDMLGSAQPVDQEVSGEQVEAHGFLVTPVARVRGKVGSQDSEEGNFRYGWVRIRPVRMSVLDRAGNIQEVPLVNAQQRAVTGMLAIGLVVAVLSVLISQIARARRG